MAQQDISGQYVPPDAPCLHENAGTAAGQPAHHALDSMNIGWYNLLGWPRMIMNAAAAHYCQPLCVTQLAGTTLKTPGLIPAKDRFPVLQCLTARIHELVPCLLQAASPQTETGYTARISKLHPGPVHTSSRTRMPAGCVSSTPERLNSARRPGVPTTINGLFTLMPSSCTGRLHNPHKTCRLCIMCTGTVQGVYVLL